MRYYLFAPSRLFAALTLVTILNHGSLVAGDEPNRIVVGVGVYYESLCRDSINWIRNQLLPSYEALKDHIKIDFVPYGKAAHTRETENGPWQFSCQHGPAECQGNKAQSCAINSIKSHESAEKVQDLTVALVGCVMSSRYPPTAVPQCAQQVELNQQTQKSINECIQGSLSSDLLAINGDKTLALNPSLTFVPTIVINGENSKKNQNEAFNNFMKLICGLLPEASKPNECSRAR